MSGPTFTSPFGNANPFGGDGGRSSNFRQPSPSGLGTMAEEGEEDTIASPISGRFNKASSPAFGGPFGGGDGSHDGPPSSSRIPPNPDQYPAQYDFRRRTSVSAESLKPTADANDNWTPPSYPKTPEQLQRLKTAIQGNFLFSHLDDEQSNQILGALQEKPIPAKDIKVCGHVLVLVENVWHV